MREGYIIKAITAAKSEMGGLAEDEQKAIVCRLMVDFALEFPRKKNAQLTINHLAMSAITEVTKRETATAIKAHRAKQEVR
ncbi:MAG: hypothetical protein AAGG79_03430 [Pseudomonadota bacterium]